MLSLSHAAVNGMQVEHLKPEVRDAKDGAAKKYANGLVLSKMPPGQRRHISAMRSAMAKFVVKAIR